MIVPEVMESFKYWDSIMMRSAAISSIKILNFSNSLEMYKGWKYRTPFFSLKKCTTQENSCKNLLYICSSCDDTDKVNKVPCIEHPEK